MADLFGAQFESVDSKAHLGMIIIYIFPGLLLFMTDARERERDLQEAAVILCQPIPFQIPELCWIFTDHHTHERGSKVRNPDVGNPFKKDI